MVSKNKASNAKISDDEGELQQRTSSALEESLKLYDQNTLNRVTKARRAALDAIPNREEKNKQRLFSFWLLGSGVAVCCLLFVVVLVSSPIGENHQKNEEAENLFTIILELEDLEMHQQDVEFYEWLTEDGVI